MKTRAAILRGSPGRFETAELDLDEPGPGEVLVRMAATGLCHSDDHLQTGHMKMRLYPAVGGHEGAGVVEQIGTEVHGLTVGDHVVFSCMISCGHCSFCARGMQSLCDMGKFMLVGSRGDEPPTYRMHLDGEPVAQFGGLATFSEYTTVDARACIRIDQDIPLDVACLVGCGVSTGWGSAVNSAGIEVGDTVIVMGVGGVGINAVQGAAHAGAENVIAVDPVALKRETAERLGATHALTSIEEANDLARSFTNGQGADSAIVTVGVTTGEHIAQAFSSIRKAGTVVVTGAGDGREVGLPVPITELVMYQKRIQGAVFGSTSPTADIPRQLSLYRSGRLKLDELITARYRIDQVAEGYEDMHAGKNIRGVVVFD
ncbi:NDMA-dependent alcohol dehydrogenase [Pseudonocardia sp. WMMC193]|uniref:NDMA-dependent alcohol dehydrogenase n=1 Tax=Pseudonocardia sp. WMMC193 TaxID=2911965 RepID=UPI001F014A61|nr:NDMA-dependent alcohol dehydrogenase [Pseudonocardia sp. WMMC193]MCF7550767.1 NDMA-dependent alcohol dehydrogenase [Pseudonocardia sp. WMMC193]